MILALKIVVVLLVIGPLVPWLAMAPDDEDEDGCAAIGRGRR